MGPTTPVEIERDDAVVWPLIQQILLSTYCVPGSVLDMGDTAVNRQSILQELTFWKGISGCRVARGEGRMKKRQWGWRGHLQLGALPVTSLFLPELRCPLPPRVVPSLPARPTMGTDLHPATLSRAPLTGPKGGISPCSPLLSSLQLMGLSPSVQEKTKIALSPERSGSYV